ncbi:MAG: type II toxin-antitoxin system VapC family toxin [Armatimonadetes bacterium]|nr:type II toxin-antitoxin system VapC family toxin [Armatimonadota bacterium]
MNFVFADTLYWVASILPDDPWHAPAVQAMAELKNAHLVTTEEVLGEVLSAFSGRGDYLRRQATRVVQAILKSDHVTVLHQTHSSFMAGLGLYESRPDKAYSLVDCISMNAMRQLSITSILTHDHHFTQEGFAVLIYRS